MPEAGGASFLPSWLRSSPGRGKKKGASKNNNKGSAAPSTPDAKQQQEQEAQRASAGCVNDPVDNRLD